MSEAIARSFHLLGQRQKDRFASKAFSMVHGLANPARNRYSDIIPWDQTRVKLKTRGNDYVNASKVTLVAKDGDEMYVKSYIATQGPMPGTVGHFWQMVHEAKTDKGKESDKPTVVIQLTPFVDKHGERCCQYYLDDPGQSFEVDGEDNVFTISVADKTKVGATQVTYFTIKNETTGKVKNVVHFFYPNWEDFSAPGVNRDIDDIIKAASPITDIPPIVHCSAGVGRTGTYIVADFLTTYQKQLHGQDVVCGLVDQLRQQRSHMVQTVHQFAYLHSLQQDLLL